MNKTTTNSNYQATLYKLLCLVIVSVLLMTGCGGINLPRLNQGSSDDIPASVLTPDSSGANAWIEFPREGMILDMKQYTFVVYAADAIGISSVNLFLNGEAFPAGQLTDLDTDGSKRQVRLDQPWTAPYEGSFTLLASAASKSGGGSPVAEIHFCIVTCDPVVSGIEITDTPTPGAVTATYETVALFDANPAAINAGGCSDLSWTVTGGHTVSLNNVPVNESGTQQVCPCVSTSYQIKIDKTDGTTEYLLTEVIVNGSCTGPSTPTPTWAAQPPTPTITPPPDTTGPTIGYTNLVFESCKVYGQAQISDSSGVGSAKFGYNLNSGGWLWVWMQNIGGGMWQSEVGIALDGGIGTLIGDIEYQVYSIDSLGNETYSTITPYHYVSCDG